jgi:anti-sigma factor RsiW
MSSVRDRERFERDHRWAPDRMSDYLDGDLAAGALTRIERHLGECDECRRLLKGLRQTLDALHRLSAPTSVTNAQAIAASVRVRLTEPG